MEIDFHFCNKQTLVCKGTAEDVEAAAILVEKGGFYLDEYYVVFRHNPWGEWWKRTWNELGCYIFECFWYDRPNNKLKRKWHHQIDNDTGICRNCGGGYRKAERKLSEYLRDWAFNCLHTSLNHEWNKLITEERNVIWQRELLWWQQWADDEFRKQQREQRGRKADDSISRLRDSLGNLGQIISSSPRFSPEGTISRTSKFEAAWLKHLKEEAQNERKEKNRWYSWERTARLEKEEHVKKLLFGCCGA